MSKWVRVDSSNTVQEVINYNPFEIVNEAFHPFFHEVSGEETYGWIYDSDTGTFSAPPEPPAPPEEPVGVATT